MATISSFISQQFVGKSLTFTAISGRFLSVYTSSGQFVEGVTTYTGTVRECYMSLVKYQPSLTELKFVMMNGDVIQGVVIGNQGPSQITFNSSVTYGYDFYSINDDGTPTTGTFTVIDDLSANPITIAAGASYSAIYVFNRGGTTGDTFNTEITATKVTDTVTAAGATVTFDPAIYGNDFQFTIDVASTATPGTYSLGFSFSGGGHTETPTAVSIIIS